MTVQKSGEQDLSRAVELARSLGLDYPGMEADRLWIAEDEGRIVGVVALRTHPGWLELCSLGVDPRHRNRGVGRALIEALMKEAPGEVHLGTLVPEYFKKQGFEKTEAVPAAFAERHDTAWCEGCAVGRCVVMKKAKA